jgi:hypothetical protein
MARRDLRFEIYLEKPGRPIAQQIEEFIMSIFDTKLKPRFNFDDKKDRYFAFQGLRPSKTNPRLLEGFYRLT